MKELYNALPLPDDRPVTAIAIIEDANKCPIGYTVVAKSYDQDLDADLWKDGFFGKRITRYLCLSKSEGPSGFVIDSIVVINDKDSPPNGYILLSKTYGTEQKAWRKRQLCYRLSEKSSVFLAITDIIVLSKAKKAPEGFTMAGEMNGLTVCYKASPLHQSAPRLSPSPTILPPLQVNLPPTSPTPRSEHGGSRTSLNSTSNNAQSPTKVPVRPAPLPPTVKLPSPDNALAAGNHTIVISAATLSGFTGLEGVPFTLGPRVQCSTGRQSGQTVPRKTPQELNSEYQYSFATERQAMFRL